MDRFCVGAGFLPARDSLRHGPLREGTNPSPTSWRGFPGGRLGAVLAAVVCLASPVAVEAQESEAAAGGEVAAEPGPAASERAEALKAIVRGLFVEGRVGGGYMALNHESPNLLRGGQLTSEEYGPGVTVQLALGYDINDTVSLQLLGGTTLVSGDRQDKPRDLSMLFGGAGVRLAFGLGERLDFLYSLGAAYVRASNAVEDPDTGVAIVSGLGLEYYVHVRHFSIGIELSGFAPTQPWRAFVALTPMIKYTF